MRGGDVIGQAGGEEGLICILSLIRSHGFRSRTKKKLKHLILTDFFRQAWLDEATYFK